MSERLLEDLSIPAVPPNSPYSDSSSPSLSSVDEDAPFEPPKSRPSYGPLEASKLLSRVRQFLPVFRDAPLKNCDPLFSEENDEEVLVTERLPAEDRIRQSGEEISRDDWKTVDMEVSLGVFDVPGEEAADKLEQMGIPVVTREYPEEQSLIQEMVRE